MSPPRPVPRSLAWRSRPAAKPLWARVGACLFASVVRLAAALSSHLLASFPEHACAIRVSAQTAAAHVVAWPSVEACEEAAELALAQLAALGWRAGDTPNVLSEALTVKNTLSKLPPPPQLAGSVWRLRALRVALPGCPPFALGWPLVGGHIAYDQSGAAMATVHRLLLMRNAYAGPWAAVQQAGGPAGEMTLLHHALINQGGSRTDTGLFGGAGPAGGNAGGTRIRAATLSGDRLFLSLVLPDTTGLCLCWQRK